MPNLRQYRIPTCSRFPRAWIIFTIIVAAFLLGAKVGGVL